MNLDDAITRLKIYLTNNPQKLKEEQEVIGKYGPMFNPAALNQLTKEQFKSFLLFKNNKNWMGIHRQGNIITKNMPKLRKALKILLDEKTDLKDRLNKLFPPNKPNLIKGLGRAVITPILMIVYPDKYGTYNKRIEVGLKILGLNPEFKGKSFAERYIKVNSILTDITQKYGVNFFQLDDMFGYMYKEENGNSENDEHPFINVGGETIEDVVSFGLEKHLEDFLIHNWAKTPLGKQLEIFEEDGDIAQQFDTGAIGRIDILTRDKKTKDWVVIELKKGRDSDKVVGQILRYIGWVQENKAANGEKVRGIIIAGEPDDRIRYALRSVPNIEFLVYEVKFILKKVEE
ncbi:unnamed protein product [marine sediment metagenome]|uniref:Endonuclease NucS C-terminal domain-containing protein n=1 Tax=marine sediment metagenome TaxID=412755 RepID=X0S2A3_9ZZZZ